MVMPYFVCVGGSIGITSRLYDSARTKLSSSFNTGVYRGPKAILTREVLEKYPYAIVQDITLPSGVHIASEDEDISVPHNRQEPGKVLFSDYNAYYNWISNMFEQIADSIYNEIKRHSRTNPRTLVTLGGDHSLASPSLKARVRLVGAKDLAVIVWDSHGDIHDKESSPSGNYQGQWLRPHISRFGHPAIDRYASEKIHPQNVLYVGNLSLEQAEKRFIQEQGIQVISQEHLRGNLEGAINKIREHLARFNHLHITCDIDCMAKTVAPGTGLPAENGLLPEQSFPLLQAIAEEKRNNLSLDIMEVNPAKDIEGKTVELAQDILYTVVPPAAKIIPWQDKYLH
jgi:arginase